MTYLNIFAHLEPRAEREDEIVPKLDVGHVEDVIQPTDLIFFVIQQRLHEHCGESECLASDHRQRRVDGGESRQDNFPAELVAFREHNDQSVVQEFRYVWFAVIHVREPVVAVKPFAEHQVSLESFFGLLDVVLSESQESENELWVHTAFYDPRIVNNPISHRLNRIIPNFIGLSQLRLG